MLLGLLLLGAVPAALRRVPWFRVARVEVSGARLLAPHEVLAASGIAAGLSVWEDPAGWEAALLRDPTIAAATVRRRLPGTLLIRIREERPVALVDGGSLRLATASGALLPVDPGTAAVDLPLLRAEGAGTGGEQLRDAGVRAAVAELGRVSGLDPALMARVSEVREDGSGLVLLFSEPQAEVRLPRGAGPARLAELRVALDEIPRRAADATGTGERPVRLDLRFRDQIVISPPSRL